jgi:hypothetical protein
MVDDLPILQEIVTLTEKEELIERDKEVGKRRMRIGGPAGKPMTKEAVEEKVFAEFAVESKVRLQRPHNSGLDRRLITLSITLSLASFRNSTKASSTTLTSLWPPFERSSTSSSSSTVRCSGLCRKIPKRKLERERRSRRSPKASF